MWHALLGLSVGLLHFLHTEKTFLRSQIIFFLVCFVFSDNLCTCPVVSWKYGLIKTKQRSWSHVCPGSELTFELKPLLPLKQTLVLWLLRVCFYPNLITYSIHTYYLAGCISVPDQLLSHYLHFSEREPELTWQSKQAVMWVWCHAYGVTTLFRCSRAEGTDLRRLEGAALICGGIRHLSICKCTKAD